MARRELDAGSIYGLTATGVAISRLETGISACDANYAAILGRSREDVIGLQMADVTHPDDVPSNEWLLRVAASAGRAFDMRKRYLLPDGSARWVENRITALTPGSDGLIVIVSRPIEPPLSPKANPAMRDYLQDISSQLALMAQASGLSVTSEAFELASLMATVEGMPWVSYPLQG